MWLDFSSGYLRLSPRKLTVTVLMDGGKLLASQHRNTCDIAAGPSSLACVLVLPMLANRIRDFDQPSPVFKGFQHVRCRKILGGILRRIAERLK